MIWWTHINKSLMSPCWLQGLLVLKCNKTFSCYFRALIFCEVLSSVHQAPTYLPILTWQPIQRLPTSAATGPSPLIFLPRDCPRSEANQWLINIQVTWCPRRVNELHSKTSNKFSSWKSDCFFCCCDVCQIRSSLVQLSSMSWMTNEEKGTLCQHDSYEKYHWIRAAEEIF